MLTWKPKAKAMATGGKQPIGGQPERLSEETSKWGCDSLNTRGNLVRESRRTFPATFVVSKLAGLKVTEWLRHTAGASFYQGQCITNDLWVQNLRSTGLLAV